MGMRISTNAGQQAMLSAIMQQQTRLAEIQRQTASGQRAADHAGLGDQARSHVSASALLARLEAQEAATGSLANRLGKVDLLLGEISDQSVHLRETLLGALGHGSAAGLGEAIANAQAAVSSAFSTRENGVALFAGDVTDSDQRPSAPTGEGRDMQYGLSRREAGGWIESALASLSRLGPFGARLDAAQREAITMAMGELDTGLEQLRLARAGNGVKQAALDGSARMASRQADLVRQRIGAIADADMAGLAVDLSRQQGVLEASYAVTARLSALTLLDYL